MDNHTFLLARDILYWQVCLKLGTILWCLWCIFLSLRFAENNYWCPERVLRWPPKKQFSPLSKLTWYFPANRLRHCNCLGSYNICHPSDHLPSQIQRSSIFLDISSQSFNPLLFLLPVFSTIHCSFGPLQIVSFASLKSGRNFLIKVAGRSG